ncbi:MAG: lipid IV(A) 3-deoxy-D-manno-octulosonic acid transferase [Pseudomonadota bacterium]
MTPFFARTLLRLYRGAGTVIYPFIGPFLRARAARGKEDRARRGERYGYASAKRPDGPLVWLHAASVGESLAVAPLLERIERLDVSIVLTTGTVTSAELAKQRVSERTQHQYVPLDLQRAVGRFLDHWKPDLAIFAESEIWPTTIRELGRRNIPQILVNARMSDRSNRRWQQRQALAEAVFGQLAQVIAQSETDAERFRALGAPWVTVAGNLKSDVDLPQPDAATLATLQSQIGLRPTWLAASTHAGEEESVAEVHALLLPHERNVLSILVPRHPDRCADIAAMLRSRGLTVVTRSSGEPITNETQVFLGDTIGEMSLYMALTRIVFMGKSLKGEGGQNPFEPAKAGAALLSGRYVQNFREVYENLLRAGAARLVRDEKMLAGHVLHLMRNEHDRDVMVKAGLATVEEMAGAVDTTIRALDAYILPLRLRSGLERLRASDAGPNGGHDSRKDNGPDNGQDAVAKAKRAGRP